MAQPVEALSTLLSYNQKRMKAMSSRSYRVVSASTNTSLATCGQRIQFRIAGNQSSSFLDNSTMYIKVKVKNTNGAPIALEGKSGLYALLFKKLTISTSGQTLSEINEFGILHSCFVDADSNGNGFGNNAGRVLFGSSDTGAGQVIANGAEATFILPFVMCNLSNARKYFPLFGRSDLLIDIETQSAALGCLGTATDAEIQFESPELIYNVVELSAPAMQAVAESVNNVFTIVADDYRHTSSTCTANANQTSIVNLGFSFSSLNRVIVAQQNQANLTNVKYCIGNRSRRDLEQVSLLINGEQLPARPIKVTDQASEALGELLIADRSLVAYDHDSRINGGAGYAAQDPTGATSVGGGADPDTQGAATPNVGNFMVQIDTESMRSPVDEHFGGLFSGISTISAVTQLQLVYGSTAPSGATNIHVYGQMTTQLVLDMNTNQQWIVAV